MRQRNFKHTKEVQCEYEHNYAQHEDEIGVGKLKSAPGDFLPRAFECDQEQRKRDKPREDPNRKSDAAPQNFLSTLARLLNESENLQRDHRQHARHQVQDDAAEKTEEQEGQDASRGCRMSRRNNGRTCDLPARAILAVWLLGKNEQACHGGQILSRRFNRNPNRDLIVIP